MYHTVPIENSRMLYFIYDLGKPESLVTLYRNKDVTQKLHKTSKERKEQGIHDSKVDLHAAYIKAATTYEPHKPFVFYTVGTGHKSKKQDETTMYNGPIENEEGKCIVRWCYISEHRFRTVRRNGKLLYRYSTYNFGTINGDILNSYVAKASGTSDNLTPEIWNSIMGISDLSDEINEYALQKVNEGMTKSKAIAETGKKFFSPKGLPVPKKEIKEFLEAMENMG